MNDSSSADSLIQAGLLFWLNTNLFVTSFYNTSIMVMEALYTDMRSGYPEELIYDADLALISEPLDGLTWKLEV